MSRPASHSPSACPRSSPAEDGQTLELELTRQVELLAAGAADMTSLKSLLDRLSQFLAAPPEEARRRGDFPDQVRRLRSLHRRLCLMLATEGFQLAEELRRLTKGRRGLAGYRSTISS